MSDTEVGLDEEMIELAEKFSAISSRMSELKERKKEIQNELQAMMKDRNMSEIPLSGNKSVVIRESRSKSIRKKDLIEKLGERKGKKLWESKNYKIYEYLTVEGGDE